jgi:hypothetical protein
MTPTLQELRFRLLRFVRERIDSSEYMEAHRQFVRRTLISWSREPALQEYVPRLLHYCLDYDSLAPPIVDLTFEYMAERCSKDNYLERLRIEFAVMDQLNSLPWAYGIRTQHGSDNQWLIPLIQPHVPIDPGCWFSRLFRTSCDAQSYIRIELFAGPKMRDRTEGCIPLLARRVRLPEGLPRGERIEVAIQRLGEAKMRLELRIPRIDGPAGPWWWIEDSAGFADLATDVARRFRELLEKEGSGGGLKPLLTGCMHLLNHHSYLLSEKDGNRLADWVQSTSRALVQRDEEGLRNALRLLLGDLDAVRNESVAVILETLVVTTGAPPEVTTELERLATLLLRHAESSDAWRRSVGVGLAKRRAVRLVEGWYARWKQESAHEQVAETMRQAEMLVGLLNAIEVPELREMAVESLMAEEPFKWGLLHHFAVTFRTSRWTEDLRQEARALVSHHFRVIEQLAMEVRQEGSYYAHAFHGFTKDSGIGAFPAEARETYQRVTPPAWLWQETSEQEIPSSDSDADELLEAIPDESDLEPVSPFSSLSSPVVSPAWAAASGAGAASRAASPRR